MAVPLAAVGRARKAPTAAPVNYAMGCAATTRTSQSYDQTECVGGRPLQVVPAQ
jgi:hypothetical protein